MSSPTPKPKSPSSAIYVDPFILVASSCSAVASRLCCHPLDTLRIRIQTWPTLPVPHFKQLIPKPRLRTLYAGLPVAIGFSVPALSVYLTAYEASKRYYAEHILPISSHPSPTLAQQLPIFVLAGTTAEFASGAIWTPLDVLKSRLQRGGEGTNSAVKLLGKIWHEEGYRGVFRGYWISNAVFVPYISLYWSMYESLKTRFVPGYTAFAPTTSASDSERSVGSSPPAPTQPQTPFYYYTGLSIISCAVSVSLTSPIELVQSRWQTSGGSGALAPKSPLAIIRTLYAQAGLRAFTRGMGVRVLYAMPANGISMTVYERIKGWRGIS